MTSSTIGCIRAPARARWACSAWYGPGRRVHGRMPGQQPPLNTPLWAVVLWGTGARTALRQLMRGPRWRRLAVLPLRLPVIVQGARAQTLAACWYPLDVPVPVARPPAMEASAGAPSLQGQWAVQALATALSMVTGCKHTTVPVTAAPQSASTAAVAAGTAACALKLPVASGTRTATRACLYPRSAQSKAPPVAVPPVPVPVPSHRAPSTVSPVVPVPLRYAPPLPSTAPMLGLGSRPSRRDWDAMHALLSSTKPMGLTMGRGTLHRLARQRASTMRARYTTARIP